MFPTPIIIDCDPGQDDAINLLLALSAPEAVDILGITTVAGNVPVELTQRNARLVCDLAGRPDMLVYQGCGEPMRVVRVGAEAVHGASGIDGLPIAAPLCPLQSLHAVEFLIETLGRASQPITLIATAALTNIATALERDPAISDSIERIILMGGAMREGGNITPSAEFNIFTDPHAADIVFRAGVPIVALGLDVTHQLLVTPERLARVGAIDNAAARAAHAMLGFAARYDMEKYGSEGGPLHDPCTLAYMLAPDLFATRPCHIAIETDSPVTRGHTAVDFWGVTGLGANALWAWGVNAEGFFDLLFAALERYSRAADAVSNAGPDALPVSH